ncbi:MAG: zinc ribbon domain-containing protein [Coriobacteriia bacterium]|nr:zinc ribbon domain-containing protein [Coriobacteriia bacterium]MDO9108480.1 zinc ribbon domain-containing protein [Coriobacteriia bacterium]
MPTYELTCKDCGEAFELFFMRMLREEDKICPACGSRDIRTGLGGGFLKTKLSAGASAPSCGDRGFT